VQIEVWFQDESRFGQQGTLTRVWAKVGTRPRAVRQTQYDYLWILSAVCPQTGSCHGLLAPFLNTDVITVYLREFSKSLAPDVHAVLVWDGAGYHTSHEVKIPDNVTLLQLPPYSPELNPVENLWHYLKSHYWSNRCYENYHELEQAVIDAWRNVCSSTDTIKSICAVPYLDRAVIY
jgi:putative transposase